MIKAEIKKKIAEAVRTRYPELGPIHFTVEEPPTGVDADFSSNVAFPVGKAVGRPPFEVVQELLPLLENAGVIKKAESTRNGFLNLEVTDEALGAVVRRACLEKEDFGKRPADPSFPVLVEFVSANPTGPLHIGHGRGAALGDSLARIYRQCGYGVQTEYYVNDLGIQMQILANSVRLRSMELDGETVSFPENGYQGEYIREIAREMKEQKRTDFETYPREFLLNTIRKDLEDFGVGFSSWASETALHESGKVGRTLQTLRSKDALLEKDGALWFKGQGTADEDEEADKDRVLKKSDGHYTYFASDIAYHQDKFDRGFKHCIDIWGHDHHGYVPRVEAAMAVLGLPAGFLKILLYQLVSLKRGGQKIVMSTRSGKFVTLKEILDEVGRDACRFFFAMRSPTSQLEFDVDLAKKQSNENPVFYVQYVHARICSIFREADKQGIKEEMDLGSFGLELGQKEERELIKKIGVYEDILLTSLEIHSPHLLADYLLDLSTRFHKFYDKHRVLNAEPAVRSSRLALLRAVQVVVKSGLGLLGVSAPEKM